MQKKTFFMAVLSGLVFLFLFVSCEEKAVVQSPGQGIPPPAVFPTLPGTQPLDSAYIFYGNYFNVQSKSNNQYEKLLTNCRRCGTTRHAENPYGGPANYSWFWSLGPHPKKYEYWLNKGYLQIAFAKNTLPTKAIVSILPFYQVGQNSQPGASFSVETTARPINKHQGFQIKIQPAEGLGGTDFLDIVSQDSNHIDGSGSVTVNVTYRHANIASVKLPKLNKQAVQKSFFGCDTWTN